MGRPAKFDRNEAIAIALDAFWEQGYEPTSVSELSSRMSITRSSFYNSFVSREALFDEVLALYGKQAPDRFLLDLKDGDPIVPAFKQIFRNLINARTEDKDAKGCLIVNGMANNTTSCEVAHVFRNIMETKISRYADLLEMAVENGEIAPLEDVVATASALVTQLLGINMMSKIIRDSEQLWKIADTILTGLGLIETPEYVS